MLVDDGLLIEAPDGTWRAETDLAAVHVPVSISALLAARLEQLEPSERAVAERGSVVGRVFEAAAVSELADEGLRPVVGRSLLALVRKEFVRPDRSELSPGDAFRFRHILIRDAAYAALLNRSEPSCTSASPTGWCGRSANGCRARGDRRPPPQFRVPLPTELGEQGDAVEHLARRAGEHYLAAARRIRDRGDAAAATALRLPPRRSRLPIPASEPSFN